MSKLINYNQFEEVFSKIKTYIDDNIQHTQDLSNENTSTYIEAVKEEIFEILANNYASLATFQEYSDALSLSFQLLQYGMNLRFESTGGNINDIYEELVNLKKDIYNNIRFDTAGLAISQNDSPFALDISEKEIIFTENNKEIVKIANNKLSANNIVVDNSLTLGAFRFIAKKNGHLSLAWDDDGSLVNPNHAYPEITVDAMNETRLYSFGLKNAPTVGELYTIEVCADLPGTNYCYDILFGNTVIESLYMEQFNDGVARKSLYCYDADIEQLTLRLRSYDYHNYIKNGRFGDVIPGSGTDQIPGWLTNNSENFRVYEGQGNSLHSESGIVYLLNRTTNRYNIFQKINKSDIAPGTEITVSFDIDWQDNVKDGGVWIEYYDKDGNEITAENVMLNYEDGKFQKGRISKTLTTPNVDYEYLALFCLHYGVKDTSQNDYVLVKFGNVKLEIGSKETAWSEHPYYSRKLSITSVKLYPGDEYWDNAYNLLSYNNVWNDNNYIWNETNPYIVTARSTGDNHSLFEYPTSLYSYLEPDTDYMFSCKTDTDWGLKGYNYITNGKFEEIMDVADYIIPPPWQMINSKSLSVITKQAVDGKIQLTNSSTDEATFYQEIDANKVAPNTEITISFDLDWELNVKDCEAKIEYYDEDGNVFENETIILNKLDGYIYSGHVETTITTIDRYSYFRICFVHKGIIDKEASADRLMTIGNVKLEKGGGATDIEDVDNVYMYLLNTETRERLELADNPFRFRAPSAGRWTLCFCIVKENSTHSFWDAKISKIEVLDEEEFVNEGEEDIYEEEDDN